MINIDIIKINLLENNSIDYFYELEYLINKYILDNDLDYLNINISPSKNSIYIKNNNIYINNIYYGSEIPIKITIYNQNNNTSLHLIYKYSIEDSILYLMLFNEIKMVGSYKIDSYVDFNILISSNKEFKLFYDGIINKVKPLKYFLRGVDE